jgi:hypothetical protein
MSNEPAPGSKSGCAAGLVTMVWYDMVINSDEPHLEGVGTGDVGR